MQEKIDKIKKIVDKYYDPDIYNWTSERSRGNYDDCFSDGFDCGEAALAYTIGCILDMDLEDPECNKEND